MYNYYKHNQQVDRLRNAINIYLGNQVTSNGKHSENACEETFYVVIKISTRHD